MTAPAAPIDGVTDDGAARGDPGRGTGEGRRDDEDDPKLALQLKMQHQMESAQLLSTMADNGHGTSMAIIGNMK